MANLSNINNKFIVQDNSRILVNKTSDTGATLQVGGSFQSDSSVRVSSGVLYVGDGSSTTARIMGFGDYEMITGVSGATYLRVSGSTTLAGTLQAGQYILASGLAYGAVNNYTQIIDGSSGAITGTTATFTGNVGIGTSSPTNLLDIKSNGNSKGLDIHHSNGNMVAQLIHGGSGDEGQLKLYDSNTETVRIAGENNIASFINSGNVGIGTTSPNHKLDIYSNENVPLRIHRPNNANLDSSGAWGIGFSTRSDSVTSTTDTRAGIFSYYNGNLFFATNTSSIVADPDASARMTITSAGYVGIGTTSIDEKLHVQVSSGDAALKLEDASNYMRIDQNSVGADGALRFKTGSGLNERMRISSTGKVGINTTSPGAPLHVDGSGTNEETNDAKIYVSKNSSNDWFIFGQSGADDYGMKLQGVGSYSYATFNHNSNSYTFRVDYGGGIASTTTGISSISDERLKKDIIDTNSQWDDIKELRFVNYKWKDESMGDGTYLGLVAQEVEAISAGLVQLQPQPKEDIDAGIEDPEYKEVKYSIVWMKAMKALQEAMARIEELEEKVRTLENA